MSTRGFEIAAWLQAKLPDPSDHRQPLRLTPWQLDFLGAFYELGWNGYACRRAALQMGKGAGKSPLAAMISVAELVGPVLPNGAAWPDPLVQIAALSEDQADSNVFALARELLVANDSRAANALGIDVGRTRFYLRGRAGKLEAVTAEAPSREGQRVTFANLDETQLWTKRNGGQALARAIGRNAAKMGGRVLETSNAPELGFGSVAEATLEDVAAGHPGILLVAQRPPVTPEPDASDDELLAALAHVYRGAPWIDTRRMLAEIRDPAVPWDEAARYYLNAPGGGASALVEPRRWAQLAADPEPIPDGSRVGGGFDGSHSYDGTALGVCSAEGRLQRELIIERPAGAPADWMVPRQAVHEAVERMFSRYDVARLYCDPYQWHTEIDGWAARYGADRVVRLATNSPRRFGPAVDRFRAALAEGSLSHAGDPALSRHLLNARLRRALGRADDDGHALYTIEKPGPGRYVDAAVASVLAHEAIHTAPPPHPVDRRLYTFT